MKRTIRHSLLSGIMTMLCGVLLLTACSKSTDLTTYIPQDALFVGNINVKTLWQKGDVDNIDNIAFIKMLRQELRNEDPQVSALVDGLLKDPASSGLYLKEDIAFYSMGEDFVLLAGVKDWSKFEDFLKECASLNQEELDIKDCDGYKQTSLGGVMTVLYNHDVAMLTNGTPDEARAKGLMKMKRGESIAGNKNFNQYWKNRKEISMWMDFGNLFKIAETNSGMDAFAETGLPKEYIDALRKGSFSCNIVFDKGAIRFVVDVQGVDAKVWKDYEGKFNTDLVNCMPEKSYAAFSYAVSMDYMIRMLENMDEVGETIDETVAGDKTVRDLLKAFGGSMAFSLFDIVQNDSDGVLPLMAVAADIKDAALVRQVIGELGLEQRDGMYVVPDILGNLYVAMNDKVVYITNALDAAKQFVAGGYKNGMKNVPGKVKSGNYVYADLNIGHYPDAVMKLIPANVADLLAKYLDYTEMTMTNNTSGEWAVYLADSKENSLLYTLHFVDDNLMTLASLTESLGGDGYEEYEDYEADEDYHLDI